MKSILLMAAVLLFGANRSQGQVNNAKTETVKVYGNCSTCENAIEKAAFKKKISRAGWNEQTKMATITYNSKETNLDAILKNIALAGYDNSSFLAPDEAYNQLPACCKYEREKKQTAMQPSVPTTMHNHADQQTDSVNSKAATEQNQLTMVWDHYFLLKDALVKTDAEAASAEAKELQTAIPAVKMDKLEMNVHAIWMKLLNQLKKDAEHIGGTKDIAQQRDHFMGLSKNMYELIQVAGPAGNVYYQFCPMANDGKGATWLSRENGIKNPYYGAQMLTCGKTTETIK